MKKIRNILWGLVFIVIGLILSLKALEIINIDIFFDGWWTLMIIIPCFIDLFKQESKIGNIIGLLIGIVLLFCCMGIFSFGIFLKLLIPLTFIMIGISFILKNTINKQVKEEIKSK